MQCQGEDELSPYLRVLVRPLLRIWLNIKYTMEIFWKIIPVLALAIASNITGCKEFQSPEPQKTGETLTSALLIKSSPKIQLLYTVPGHLRFSVTSVAISPDGQILVSGSNDKTIKIWNLHTGKPLRTLIEAQKIGYGGMKYIGVATGYGQKPAR